MVASLAAAAVVWTGLHFDASKLTIRLSRVVECVRGRREFSRIAWKGGTETLPCSFLKQRR